MLLGSPPPMRGKGHLYPRLRVSYRITPAYAGKSSVFLKFRPPTRDHPRLCGEKFFRNIWIWQSCRITPAYAGKSADLCIRQQGIRDHPRLCGEKGVHGCRTAAVVGSPPPMRGKGIGRMSFGWWIRITPAYAGKSEGNIR